MRHLRMVGLCLVAVFAIAAVAATSASALPEWAKCEKVKPKTGAYTDANCTIKAIPLNSGEFKLLTGKEVEEKRIAKGKKGPVPFSGHSVSSGGVLTTVARECWVENVTVQLRTTRKHCTEEGTKRPSGEERLFEQQFKVECANEVHRGEAKAPNLVKNVHVTFTGCALFGSTPCKSSGKAEGEIETLPLKGKLGYIKKAAHEVGVLLEPAKAKGAFAAFECGGTLGVVVGVGNENEGAEYASSGSRVCFGTETPPNMKPAPECTGVEPTPAEEKHGGYDGIISPITPVNQMTSTYTQTYTEEAEYPFRNLPSKFEGKHIDVLEDYIFGVVATNITTDWMAAGEVVTVVNNPEEEGEIKA
jgi:hypothetical protein